MEHKILNELNEKFNDYDFEQLKLRTIKEEKQRKIYIDKIN